MFRRLPSPFSGQIQPALGMLVRCADGTRCSPFACALFFRWNSPKTGSFHIGACVPEAAIDRFDKTKSC